MSPALFGRQTQDRLRDRSGVNDHQGPQAGRPEAVRGTVCRIDEELMIIRDYKPDDFPMVAELWKETGIFAEERRDAPGLILDCNRQGGKFIVLEDPGTGRIAGTSWLTFDGRRIYLHHFAVAPYLQGKGFGRRLAVESLRYAHEKGFPVKLEVHRENLPAVNLYRSMGFENFREYEIFRKLDP